MPFQLVALSGNNKGSSWTVDDTGLVLGRDPACQVKLKDAMASRRHCRLFQQGSNVYFEDLDSRNPALVNGVPLKYGALKAGDEIAIGLERFILSASVCAGIVEHSQAKEPTTGSWLKSELAVLKLDLAMKDGEHRPKTVHDLFFLYETACELGSINSLDDLLKTLRRRLDERFQPDNVCFALVHGGDDLDFRNVDDSAERGEAFRPLKAIQKALRKRQAMIAWDGERRRPEGYRYLTAIAPVVLGETILAVLALQSDKARRLYDEEDLRLLVCLSRSVASILCAVKQSERLRRENERLRARAGEALILVGKSKAIQQVRQSIRQGAPSDMNVLVTGPTGTGKELVARLLHAESTRAAGPFVVTNCAAIPRDMFENELFGHEKGAFTGAEGSSDGLIAQAHLGTLFLDEVGDLSLENQARILRAVEYGTFRRIGAMTESYVDIRIVAATNRDLLQAIRNGAFREDLYHRLSQFRIHIPPLRERPSDVSVLAEHFFELAKDRAKHPLAGIAPECIEYLEARQWPGNARELRNCIFRAVQICREDQIRLNDVTTLDPHVLADEAPILSLAEMEKRHITDVLHQCNGSIREAANALRVARSTLYLKIAEYNIR